MLDVEDHDLFGGLIDSVVNEITISTGYEFAHAFRLLLSAHVRKKQEVLQARIDCRPHTLGGSRISGKDVIGNFDDVRGGARRKAQLHRSKRRNAASTSASLANSPRFA